MQTMADETGPDFRGELRRRGGMEAICGRCEDAWVVPAETFGAAKRWLRDEGWRLTAEDGWVCPVCRKRR
jgi:hypothetical protein